MGFRRLRDFNIAMLGKQVWCIIKQPNSFISRILRARYFPRGEVLEAGVGSSPSLIWRSIVAALPAVRDRLMFRIGYGTSIRVWKDKWIPFDGGGRTAGGMISELEDTTVKSLMKEDGSNWDCDVLRDIFNEEDCEAISGIPLKGLHGKDELIWAAEKNGKYSVLSCYRMLSPHVENRQAWTQVWKLNLPPKMKTFFWQVCTDCLPSKERLLQRRVPAWLVCSTCGVDRESTLHVFRDCVLAKEV
ncbi:unnamed protein product [Cuscuta epithymum]|uniref:Reverse transcriptase zinc-binding domain-containing protein n=1 Tax=Cuscuta epithymum TaxID=186058 RepID=A0AAV0DJ59_9ASTE|nr:unnamed protein product [Cuscuta epithymum]